MSKKGKKDLYKAKNPSNVSFDKEAQRLQKVNKLNQLLETRLVQDIGQTQEEYRDSQEQYFSLLKRTNDRKKEIDKLENKRRSSKEELDALYEQIESLRDYQRASLVIEDECREDIQGLIKKIGGCKGEIAKQRENHRELQESIRKRKDQFESLINEHLKASDYSDLVSKDIQDLKELNNILENKQEFFRGLKEQLQGRNEKISKKQSHHYQLGQNYKKLAQGISAAKKQLHALDKVESEIEFNITQILTDINNHQFRLNALVDEISKKERSTNDSNDFLLKKNHEFENLQKELQAKATEFEGLKTSTGVVQMSVEELEDNSLDLEVQIKALDQEAKKYSSIRDHNQKRFAELKVESRDLKERLFHKQQQTESLLNDNLELKSNIQKQTEEHRQIEQDLKSVSDKSLELARAKNSLKEITSNHHQSLNSKRVELRREKEKLLEMQYSFDCLKEAHDQFNKESHEVDQVISQFKQNQKLIEVKFNELQKRFK